MLIAQLFNWSGKVSGKKNRLLMAQEAAEHCALNVRQLLKVIANTSKDVAAGCSVLPIIILEL